MSSISVRFNSFLFSYSIFNDQKRGFYPLVGLDGFEPSTSRLSGARSNHLSYKPFTLCFLILPILPVCVDHLCPLFGTQAFLAIGNELRITL